jgi:hypothetical protein
MFSIIETVATAVILLLLMMLAIHLIRGDAGEWLVNKFRVDAGVSDTTTDTPSTNGNDGTAVA